MLHHHHRARRWIAGTLCALSAAGMVHAVGAQPVGAQPVGAQPPHAIVVDNSVSLQNAMVPGNAGRLIVVVRGSYEVEANLVVPDGATLEGEGVMLGDSQPEGFEPGTETRISAAAGFSGDLITLGNGASIKGLQLAQVFGAAGNVVMVGSRESGDSIKAYIEDCEIITPNPPGITPQGPIGEGVVLTTQNANAFAPPSPHEDAEIAVRMRHSIVRSDVGGRAINVINFGSRGTLTADFSRNHIVGGLNVAGGVSRGDQVEGAVVFIRSQSNVYSSPDASVPAEAWQVFGGSSVPIMIPAAETNSNAVYFGSNGDRIEGFTQAILGAAGNRFTETPGAVSHNLLDMRLRGLTIESTNLPGTVDFELSGGRSDGEFSPGDGNVVRMLVRTASGSGFSDNTYANVLAPSGPQDLGVDNRLTFVGSATAFDASNQGFDPAPGSEFFEPGE